MRKPADTCDGRAVRVVTTTRRPSASVLRACARFGLAVRRTSDASHRDRARRAAVVLDSLAGAGGLTLLLGPSGSGKSSAVRALGAMLRRRGGAVVMAGAVLNTRAEHALIDVLAGPLDHRLSVLASAGLGEAALLARRVSELSEGERARAGLALAMARCARRVSSAGLCTLIIDEFTSGLDLATGVSLGASLARWCARQAGCRVIAASSREELGAAVTDAAVIQTTDLYATVGAD